MRRALVVVLGLCALVLVGFPGLAAESEHATEHATTEHATTDDGHDDTDTTHDEDVAHAEEPVAFGEGQWDGLLAAAAAAAVFGIVVFLLSNAGVADEEHAGDHH